MDARESASLRILAAEEGRRKKRSWMASFLRFVRKKPLGGIGIVLILGFVVPAILANVIAPYDPYEVRQTERLQSPSQQHWLGTDNFGRDMLSRIIWGSRISLWVGGATVILGTLAGSTLGIVSGYAGGRIDLLVQRCIDVMMAFPALVLALTIMAVLGPSMNNVIAALSVVMTPGMARVVRGSVLSVKQNQYIEAARSIGCGHLRIAVRHILPNVAAPIIIIATAWLGTAILSEASLSFLGVGTPPPAPSWGSMLSGPGRAFLEVAPWLAIFPGLIISVAVLGYNLLGDALRDIWDPRLRGSQ